MTLIERLDPISKSIESTIEIPEFKIEPESAAEENTSTSPDTENQDAQKPKRKLSLIHIS